MDRRNAGQCPGSLPQWLRPPRPRDRALAIRGATSSSRGVLRGAERAAKVPMVTHGHPGHTPAGGLSKRVPIQAGAGTEASAPRHGLSGGGSPALPRRGVRSPNALGFALVSPASQFPSAPFPTTALLSSVKMYGVEGALLVPLALPLCLFTPRVLLSVL